MILVSRTLLCNSLTLCWSSLAGTGIKMTRKSGMLASDLLSFYLLQIRSQLSCEGVRERNVSEMNTDTENTETEARDIPTPEQCFYASFKIYLSDSRTNSICELEDSGQLLYTRSERGSRLFSDSVQSEVVRIEKTLEVLNVTDSEEEKTISISPVNRNPDDDTDLDVDDVEIEHFYYKPRLVITNSDRSLKSEYHISYCFVASIEDNLQDHFPSLTKAKTAPQSRTGTRDVLRNFVTDDMRAHR